MTSVMRFDAKLPTQGDVYTLDFSTWLGSVPGDTLVSALVSASPSDLVMQGLPLVGPSSVGQQIGGGTVGVDYTVTFVVLAASGRSDIVTAMLFCGVPAVVGVPANVTLLGARVLRKLGIAIIADADRPGDLASASAAVVAAQVLLQLGVPVAEGDRPAAAGVIAQAEIASRAMRSIGIDPQSVDTGTATGIVYTAAALATSALVKLSVIAPDETPSTLDLAEAVARVSDVHDMLTGLDYVVWGVNAVPAGVAEWYIVMASNALAPQFGKPANLEAFQTAQDMVRKQGLSSDFGQSLAVAKVVEVHEFLNAAGLVSWSVDAVPLSQGPAYVQLVALLLAPVMGVQQDPQSRALDRAAWDGAVADVRKASVVAGALSRAIGYVNNAQNELSDLGLAGWDPDNIPPSMVDPLAALASLQMAPEFGKDADPKDYAFALDRVRKVAMGGAAGQALAVQKVQTVHYGLEARGHTRWSIYDIPTYAEEDYVLLAAGLLAPEFQMKADPAWASMAEMDLLRITALPTLHQPVRGVYF